MACTIVQTPAVGAASWTGWITQQGLTDRGFMQVSLTEFATTAASLIGTGSVFELAGSIYSCSDAVAIGLATGTASAAVAVYYVAIPSAGGTVCTFVMDDTAPTWVDAKQGYYASAASTSRYLGGSYIGTAATYYSKWVYGWLNENGVLSDAKDSVSAVRVTKNDAQSISNDTVTIVQYDDEVFDNLGEFASYRFTAKEAGYYMVAASLRSAVATFAVTEYWRISIYKNGVLYSHGLYTTDNSDLSKRHSIITDIVNLAATEYIDIRIYQNLGSAVSTDTDAEQNYFTVHRLS